MRLLAFNARGTDYIRQGQSSCRVLVVAEDEAVAAAIVPGAGRGHDYYALDAGGQQKKYTKLAGGVPDEVAGALHLTALS